MPPFASKSRYRTRHPLRLGLEAWSTGGAAEGATTDWGVGGLCRVPCFSWAIVLARRLLADAVVLDVLEDAAPVARILLSGTDARDLLSAPPNEETGAGAGPADGPAF